MSHSYEELKKKNVGELRDIAKSLEHEAVKGYTQLNKEHLLDALCVALGIDQHAHHDVVGIDKQTVKRTMKAMRKKRDIALADHDHVELKRIRRVMHRLKRKIHKATV
jgi:hypothetical protein